MSHKAEIIPGSLKRNAVTGGVEFHIRCCGELEASVHIQNMAAFESHEQRLQVIQQYLDEHATRHAAEVAAGEFLNEYLAGHELTGNCGCK